MFRPPKVKAVENKTHKCIHSVTGFILKSLTDRFESGVQFLGDLQGVASSTLEVVREKRCGRGNRLERGVHFLAQLTSIVQHSLEHGRLLLRGHGLQLNFALFAVVKESNDRVLGRGRGGRHEGADMAADTA